MASRRIFYVMVTVLILLMGTIIGAVYIGNTALHTESKKLVAAKLKSQVLIMQEASITKAKSDIAAYSSLKSIAESIVPQDKDQAEVIRQIIKIADESGMKPSAITFPHSTLNTTNNASQSVPDGVTTLQDTFQFSQLTPVVGLAHVYTLPITISQNASSPVSYSQVIDFLARLEQNRRTTQVTDIVLTPSPADHTLLSYTITINEYIKR